MKKFLCTFLLVFCLLACADRKDNDKDLVEEVSFNSQVIEKSLNGCSPSEPDCTYIYLNFPVANSKEEIEDDINNSINQFLRNTIDYQNDNKNVSPEELAHSFISDYKTAIQEFEELEPAWEASITGKVLLNNTALISIEFNTNMFTGGAHGFQSLNYLNFNPETGEMLRAKDLFSEDFSAIVEKDFREKQGIEAGVGINSTGLFFEEDQFELPTNIGFTEKKVILHYNSYEIAPYSSGSFTLTYPISSIQEYLKLSDNDR